MQLINFSNQNNLKQALISQAIEPIIPRLEELSISEHDNHALLLAASPQKILYTIKETAKVLNVSYEYVRSKVYAGIIRNTSFGSRKLIHINEVSRLMSEGIPS